MRIGYSPSFLRQFKSLPNHIQEEAHEAIKAFSDKKNHVRLNVHKLKGRLAGEYSFYVNYKIRIVFEYSKPSIAILLAIGDHDIYKR